MITIKVIMLYKNDYIVLEEKDFEDNIFLGLFYFMFGNKIAPYVGLLK